MTHFLVALIRLGIGWNFMFVGATTLLGDVHSPAARARVQGLNDTFVFTAVTFSSFAAGALVTHFGWVPTNLLALYATSLEPAQVQPIFDIAEQYKIFPKPVDAQNMIAKL